MKKNSERSAAMRFTMKLSILLTPFIALLVVYFLNDPFMVLRHYNRYDNSPVMLNEGYIGWQMYMNNRDSIAFDSFIMGNSCTMAYHVMNGKIFGWWQSSTPVRKCRKHSRHQ